MPFGPTTAAPRASARNGKKPPLPGARMAVSGQRRSQHNVCVIPDSTVRAKLKALWTSAISALMVLRHSAEFMAKLCVRKNLWIR
jgi:hypothetical protein